MAITTDRDRVRLLIGDTDTSDQLFQDDEIAYFLTLEPVVLKAAARACDAAAAKFSRGFKFKTDDQEFDPSSIAASFRGLAQALRAQATGVTGVVPTKVDGYSQDIAADEVATGASTRGRQNWFTNNDRVF